MRGEPFGFATVVECAVISTHSPRAGRTELCSVFVNRNLHFNSLAPCGANLCRLEYQSSQQQFQLTRPVRGEPVSWLFSTSALWISTHSPRAGRTRARDIRLPVAENFNSLAPCGANPNTACNDVNRSGISTHSPRAGRTSAYPLRARERKHFNSLAPCGANHDGLPCGGRVLAISTHSPRAGRTMCNLILFRMFNKFQLTRPVRGEPCPFSV